MRYSRLNDLNTRRRFDPKSSEDLKELKHFVLNNSWTTLCPFYLEDPWEDIPTMCKDKFVTYTLKRMNLKSPK
jgi:hypothetical protein